MATPTGADFAEILRVVRSSPYRYVWSSYDEEADVLYINFKKPAHATDSQLTDDDIIVRYEGDEVIGLSILHATNR